MIAQSIRAAGDFREKAGLSGFAGVATFCGLAMCLYGWRAGRTGFEILVVLGCLALFTFVMILAQWFERWTKRTTAQSEAREQNPMSRTDD
jgi:hypothetical protein